MSQSLCSVLILMKLLLHAWRDLSCVVAGHLTKLVPFTIGEGGSTTVYILAEAAGLLWVRCCAQHHLCRSRRHPLEQSFHDPCTFTQGRSGAATPTLHIWVS